MLARGAGSTARSVGRARDIEPGHRRDGIALALLGVAVVVAASSWFDAARPVGGWIDRSLRVLVGSARACYCRSRSSPIAVMLMRTEPDPDARPRLILGAAMIALPVLGLWHLWSGFAAGSGRPAARRRVHRLRDRRPTVRRADPVDRRPAVVHRRAVRCAADDRHDDPRGARHACGRCSAPGRWEAPMSTTTSTTNCADVRRRPSPRTSPTATTTIRRPTPTTQAARPSAERHADGQLPPRRRGADGARARARAARRKKAKPGQAGARTEWSRGRTPCRRWICWSQGDPPKRR